MINIGLNLNTSDGSNNLTVTAAFDSNWCKGLSIKSVELAYNKLDEDGAAYELSDKITLCEMENGELTSDYFDTDTAVITEDEQCITGLDFTLNLNSLTIPTKNPLYVIYVNVEWLSSIGDIAAFNALPCKDQKNSYFAMIYNWDSDVATALCIADSLKDSCSIPKLYIDKLLALSVIRFAIENKNIDKALEYLYFFDRNISKSTISKCNCYGKISI